MRRVATGDRQRGHEADPRYLTKRGRAGRLEFACAGGFGRTGTALSCLAILDGIPASEAVTYVRMHYSHRAVETPWQRRFVKHFHGTDADTGGASDQ